MMARRSIRQYADFAFIRAHLTSIMESIYIEANDVLYGFWVGGD
jgi:hypothetical protein